MKLVVILMSLVYCCAIRIHRNTLEKRQEFYDLARTVKIPQGFSIGIVKDVAFEAQEVQSQYFMNLVYIRVAEPTTTYTGLFTTNAFCGHPVVIGREKCRQKMPLRGLVINNRISNVGNRQGLHGAKMVCEAVEQLEGGSIIPCSTGIIGWELPVDAMIASVPALVEASRSNEYSMMDLAQAIMTTDRFPKVAQMELPGGARIVGVAKGAGMVEPNMGTMLAFILTDLKLPEDLDVDKLLKEVWDETLNSISIDSDTSTSDSAFLISSNMVPVPLHELTHYLQTFRTGLLYVAHKLAKFIVMNGEGTQHVIQVSVDNSYGVDIARGVGKKVVNSPLVKTALAGEDPNIGRIAAAVGNYLSGVPGGEAMVQEMKMYINDELVYDGAFLLHPKLEKRLKDQFHEANLMPEVAKDFPLHDKSVNIQITFTPNCKEFVTVLGSDLTKEYVDVNTGYRS